MCQLNILLMARQEEEKINMQVNPFPAGKLPNRPLVTSWVECYKKSVYHFIIKKHYFRKPTENPVFLCQTV